MTRRLLLLVSLAAITGLTACAPLQMPTASQQGGQPLLAPSGAAPVPIGRIGRPGHYQVGPITAHPSGPVCSPTWYKRGFVSSFIETWNMDVLSAQTQINDAHMHPTPTEQEQMKRILAMSITPPLEPPAPTGFANGTCRSTSDNLGGTDGQHAAEHAWYTEHKRLIAEHVLTY